MYDILKKKPPLNYNGNGLTKNSEDFEYLTGYPEELWVKKTKDYNKSKLHKGLIKLDCDLDIKLNSAFMAGFYDGVKEADECGYKRGKAEATFGLLMDLPLEYKNETVMEVTRDDELVVKNIHPATWNEAKDELKEWRKSKLKSDA